jgi:hypothetical protein
MSMVRNGGLHGFKNLSDSQTQSADVRRLRLSAGFVPVHLTERA